MKFIKYEQARSIIEDGDVVFVRGTWRNPVQMLIMLATSSPLTHCFIAFWMTLANGDRRLMLVEAQGGTRRRILSFSFYEDRDFIVCKAPAPWAQKESVALARIGKAKYGIFNAVYVGLCDFMWNKLRIRLPKFNTRQEICSEFIARVYDIKPAEVSPAGLFSVLERK